jgi:CSLREA domain-containing protein
LVLGALGGPFAAVPVGAVQYEVTTSADHAGACTPTDCSLREAVLAANATAELDHPAGWSPCPYPHG